MAIFLSLIFIIGCLFVLNHYVSEKKKALQEEEKKERERKIAERKAEEEKRRLEIERQEKEEIDKIEQVPIVIDDSFVITRNKMSEMVLPKFSTITKRTNILSVSEFVVIDIETTGIAINKSQIIELSAVRFEEFEPVEIFTTLINPKKHIPEDATEVNNITDEMVADMPELRQVVKQFIDFVGKSTIIGHNLLFDLRHLYHYGVDFSSNRKFCTYELAKKAIKNNYIRNYKLTTVCDYLDVTIVDAHRSMYDCIATGRVFKELCSLIID